MEILTPVELEGRYRFHKLLSGMGNDYFDFSEWKELYFEREKDKKELLVQVWPGSSKIVKDLFEQCIRIRSIEPLLELNPPTYDEIRRQLGLEFLQVLDKFCIREREMYSYYKSITGCFSLMPSLDTWDDLKKEICKGVWIPSVLDVGAGSGFFAKILSIILKGKKNPEIFATDRYDEEWTFKTVEFGEFFPVEKLSASESI